MKTLSQNTLTRPFSPYIYIKLINRGETRVKQSIKQFVSITILVAFLFNVTVPSYVYAQATPLLDLPQPGAMVSLSDNFVPPQLKGIKVDPKNPFKFNFFIDSGNANLTDDELNSESTKLIKYFLTSLTVPEKDLWVNLSPYEKNRIIPDEFGQTEMGREFLAQDYLLKQLTASLFYPEEGYGKKFWDKIYEQAYEQFGNTDVPVDTFHKVWIVPDKAVVYEEGGNAFVGRRHLKVMLEEDFVALRATSDSSPVTSDSILDTSHEPRVTNLIKSIIIPAIEYEVNSGQNFAKLRQIYNSLILSAWYKKRLKNNILSQKFVDQNKIDGVDVENKKIKEKIYGQYLAAFKNGVYNYIKEEYDPKTQQVIPRKYFSGGVSTVNVSRTLKIMPASDNMMAGLESNIVGDTFDVAIFAATSKAVNKKTSRRSFLMQFASMIAAGTVMSTLPRSSYADTLKEASNQFINIPPQLLEMLDKKRIPLGDHILGIINGINHQRSTALERNLNSFVHALNSSDWLAASLLVDDVIDAKWLHNKQIQWLFQGLLLFQQNLKQLAPELAKEGNPHAFEEALKKNFIFEWKFGKAPLITDTKQEKHTNVKAMEFFLNTLGVFKDLDFLNNLFRKPAYTASGASVNLSNEHNWAYMFWKQAENEGLIPKANRASFDQKKEKTVLVHWDAHKDFSAKGVSEDSFNSWQKAIQSEQFQNKNIAEAAAEMGIAGFIIPALYEGLIDEVVMVVPKEARQTKATYWIEEGEYTITVGDYEEIGTQLGIWADHPELRTYTTNLEVFQSEAVKPNFRNTRKIKLHVVSPESITKEPQRWVREEDHVILDVDLDVFGTEDPKSDGLSLPEYKLNKNSFAELFNNLSQFYKRTLSQIKCLSIARSLNFTVDVRASTSSAKILELTLENNDTPHQPSWAKEELAQAQKVKLKDVAMLSQSPLQQIAEAYGLKMSDITKNYGQDADEEKLIAGISPRVQVIANQWKRNGVKGGYQGNIEEDLQAVWSIAMDSYQASDDYNKWKISERILKNPATLAHLIFELNFHGEQGEKKVSQFIQKRITDDVEYRLLEAWGKKGQELSQRILASNNPYLRVFHHLFFLKEFAEEIRALYVDKIDRDSPVSKEQRTNTRNIFRTNELLSNLQGTSAIRHSNSSYYLEHLEERLKKLESLSSNKQKAQLIELMNEIKKHRIDREDAAQNILWSAFFDFEGPNAVRDIKTFSNVSYLDMAYFRHIGGVELNYDGYVLFDQHKRSAEESLPVELAAEKLLAETFNIHTTVHGPFLGHPMKGGNTLQSPIDFINASVEQIVGAQKSGKKTIVFHMADLDEESSTAYADLLEKAYAALNKDKHGDPKIKVALENYPKKDQGNKFPIAIDFMRQFKRIGNELSKRAEEGNENAKGALQYLFSALFDSAHYNLTNQDDPYASSYIVATELMQFGNEMAQKFGFGAYYYKNLLAELHLNQNIGMISYFDGFSADIHAGVNHHGPIANYEITALFYALGFTPFVTMEQMDEFDEDDKNAVMQGIELGKKIYSLRRRGKVFINTPMFYDFLKEHNVEELFKEKHMPLNLDAYGAILFIYFKENNENNFDNAAKKFDDHIKRRIIQELVGGFAFRETSPFKALLPEGVQYANTFEISKYFPEETISYKNGEGSTVTKTVHKIIKKGQTIEEEKTEDQKKKKSGGKGIHSFGAFFILKAAEKDDVAGYVKLENGELRELRNGDPVGEIVALEVDKQRTADVYLAEGATMMGFTVEKLNEIRSLIPDFDKLIKAQVTLRKKYQAKFEAASESQKNKEDKAIITDNTGGIDFNTDYLELDVKSNSDEALFSMPQTTEEWDDMNINGLVPIILNITPVNNLHQFLGRKETSENLEELSLHNKNNKIYL